MNYKAVILIVLLALGIIAVSLVSKQGTDTKPTKVVSGSKVADFTLTDTTGKAWSLSALKGKVVVLNFWASWCDTCKEEKPLLQKLADSMQGKDIVFLTVLYRDDPKDAEAYMKKSALNLPILIDTARLASSFGLTGVPETVIIDKNGILVDKFIGPRDWLSSEAKNFLNKLIER